MKQHTHTHTHTHALRIAAAAILTLILISTGAAAAADNVTQNATNATNSTADNLPYYMSDQYLQDVQYWYDYHTQNRATGYESTLRAELNNLLHSGTLTAEERNDAILIKLGWDFRLENYMDATKRTIDEQTGAVSYNLGIGNWWAKLWGNGTKEETLPQSMAEGDALYRIYSENYAEWIAVLKGDSDE